MRTIAAILIVLGAAAPSHAQDGPSYSVEVLGGYHPFLDDGGSIDHVAVGATAKARSGRLHVGPELIYMKGPGFDDDLVLNAVSMIDLFRRDDFATFFVAAVGAMHHWGEFDRESGWAPFLDFGGGVRINATERVYANVEVRIGLEAHVRFTGSVGWKFGR